MFYLNKLVNYIIIVKLSIGLFLIIFSGTCLESFPIFRNFYHSSIFSKLRSVCLEELFNILAVQEYTRATMIVFSMKLHDLMF